MYYFLDTNLSFKGAFVGHTLDPVFARPLSNLVISRDHVVTSSNKNLAPCPNNSNKQKIKNTSLISIQ